LGEKRIPRLTADQVISILARNGFVRVGGRGSHQKWRNSVTGRQVIVYRGRILPLGTMNSIIEGSGLDLTEWS